MSGKIQKQDIKTEAELIAGGSTKVNLPNDTQIYVTANSINKTLDQAIIDHNIGAGDIKSDGSVTFAANESMGGFKLTNLAAGTTAGDSVRYEQTILASGANAFSADQSMGSHKLTNVTDPGSAQDAATKNYVDSQVSGITSNGFAVFAVDAVLDSNTTLTGALTVDGYLTTVNVSRVLVTSQVAPQDNGIYLVKTGAWTRVTDLSTSSQFYSNLHIFSINGTNYARTDWVLVTSGAIVVNTTPLSFVRETPLVPIVVAVDLVATYEGLATTIDNTAVSAGTRVLSPGPGTAAGVYVRDPTNAFYSRDTQLDTSAKFNAIGTSLKVVVLSGNNNANTEWSLITSGTINLNTTSLTFKKLQREAQRRPARVVQTTTEVGFFGLPTVDGVTLSSGDRLFLSNSGINSGVWRVNTGFWDRATDYARSEEFYQGLPIHITEGTVYGKTNWVLATADPITLASTSMTFFPSSTIIYEATSSGGNATETLTFTGLASTDDILSVSQRVDGGNLTPIIGWANQTTNALDVTWTADPTAGAIIRIAVRKR